MATPSQIAMQQRLAQKKAAKGKTTSLTNKLSSGGFSSSGTTGASTVKPVGISSPTSPSLKGTGVNGSTKMSPLNTVKPTQGLGTVKKATGLTNKNIPPKNTTVDTFGDVGKKSTFGQTVTPGARLSNGQTVTKETAKAGELGNLSVRGSAAIQANQQDPNTIIKRNDQVIQNLTSQGVSDQAGIKAYLESQPGFLQATPEDQANTLNALTLRMGIGSTATATAPDGTTLTTDQTEGSPEYDMEGNLRAKEQSDLVEQTNADREYLQGMREKQIQIQDLEGNIITIQNSQELDRAHKQLDNMRQQFGYLGSGGQPGQSSGHLDAMKTQISDAEKVYGQLQQMIQNKEQMRELGIEMDSKVFDKQMADLQSSLDSQVTKAVQEKINSINAMSEGGKIDTMEELQQVKGTMMQELDKSIANIAISNISDRKLILDRYNQVIQQGQQFVENKNTVNKDLSAAKGYYVDGNGNAMMGDNGLPIPMPTEAPMKPVFQDGQLITFSTGANGEIVAKAQQVMDKPAMDSKAMMDVMGAISEGKISAQAAAQLFPSLAGAISAQNSAMSGGVTSQSYQGPDIAPVQPDKMDAVFQDFTTTVKEGTRMGTGRDAGQCANFVNLFLKEAGSSMIYKDPIDIRVTQSNSSSPTVGSIAIFDSRDNPNSSDAAQKRGHVAIVESINPDGTLNILESNGNGKGVVGRRRNVKPTTTYFDPTLGLKKGEAQQGGGMQGAEPTASELAYYAKGAEGIGKNKLSEQRYNEISQRSGNADTSKSGKDGALIQGIGREFVESGKMPTEYVLKTLGGDPSAIIEQGVNNYVTSKNKGLSKIGFQIIDPSVYLSADEGQRKDMGIALKGIPSLVENFDRWKELVDKHGTELNLGSMSSDASKEMKQLRTNILTNLKSEAFLNLGVLQQVDLDFMAGLIPNTNRVGVARGDTDALERAKQYFLDKVKNNGANMGMQYTGGTGGGSTPGGGERGPNPYR